MTVTVTVGELQQIVSGVNDATEALSADLTNLPADQAVILDGLKIAAMFDPELAPVVIIEPLAAAIVAYLIAKNTQGQPGSQTPIISSKKGSDPWEN